MDLADLADDDIIRLIDALLELKRSKKFSQNRTGEPPKRKMKIKDPRTLFVEAEAIGQQANIEVLEGIIGKFYDLSIKFEARNRELEKRNIDLEEANGSLSKSLKEKESLIDDLFQLNATIVRIKRCLEGLNCLRPKPPRKKLLAEDMRQALEKIQNILIEKVQKPGEPAPANP